MSLQMTAEVHLYDDLEVGTTRSFHRTIASEDVMAFASLSGDMNPLHVDEEFGRQSKFSRNVVHGMLAGSLFSTLVGMYCPGEKSLYLSQTLQFRMPLFYGDTIEVIGVITHKYDAIKVVKMKTTIVRGSDVIISGEATVQMLG